MSAQARHPRTRRARARHARAFVLVCALAAMHLGVSARDASGADPSPPVVVDSFDEVGGWSAHPADGVELAISPDAGEKGGAMRLDFDFVSGGGYAVARRALDLDLPENYAFTFRIRGTPRHHDATRSSIPRNHIEFKLIDSTGANVWWHVVRDYSLPPDWETIRIKKRQVQFAWGPAGGGEIRHVAAIELAITAGQGGHGSVWIDDLALSPLPPADAVPPQPTANASSSSKEHYPNLAIDDKPASAWQSSTSDAQPWIALDLHGPREFGGLIIDWAPGLHAIDYAVELSDDARAWRIAREVRSANGGRDYVYMPESESSHLRVRALASEPSGIAISNIAIQPLAWAATREAFFEAIARDVPPGCYPRGISGEQVYWTVVGVDGDAREGLLSEDGMLETGKGEFSIEPFLEIDGHLVTWADVQSEQSLEEGWMPIPSVAWREAGHTSKASAERRRTKDLYSKSGLTLTITACGIDRPGASSILSRYRVENRSSEAESVSLHLAIRPFQVNPPAQFLNMRGGTAPIRSLAREGRIVRVNGDRAVVSLTQPSDFRAWTFDEGDPIAERLLEEAAPKSRRRSDDDATPSASAGNKAASNAHHEVTDPFEAASGVLRYRLSIPPGEHRDVVVSVPLYELRGDFELADVDRADLSDAFGAVHGETYLGEARQAWTQKIGGVQFELPESARHVADALRAQVGYILVNRAGPAIQPGTRAYARSWIRDGALTSSALLRVGLADPAREFIEWFAPNQYANGKIPCVVDWRGPDPVPEHDSSGEFIFLIAEYLRYTGDRALAERHWPRVAAAAAYLDSLRQTRRTDEYRAPEKREFFGLLPPSISHEGYSAKPMHSYWDDFWAVRGFRDAAWLAGEVGGADAAARERERARLAAIADEFERDVIASIDAAMARHGIDYIPGCADLGDFDATSTTIALSPVGIAPRLPRAALERTFETYWESFEARHKGRESWDAYTPYEIRNIGAFVHLDRLAASGAASVDGARRGASDASTAAPPWRDRAHELLDFFLSDQRPTGWRQWPEVIRHDARAPNFLGDLPHTWVGSDYIRSVLDMFAYVRDSDGALVVGAGIPASWVSESPGVDVRSLPTPYGPLDLGITRSDRKIVMRVAGDFALPESGVVVPLQSEWLGRSIDVNGTRVEPGGDEIILHALPARITLDG
jgi:hypothetical protein